MGIITSSKVIIYDLHSKNAILKYIV